MCSMGLGVNCLHNTPLTLVPHVSAEAEAKAEAEATYCELP